MGMGGAVVMIVAFSRFMRYVFSEQASVRHPYSYSLGALIYRFILYSHTREHVWDTIRPAELNL